MRMIYTPVLVMCDYCPKAFHMKCHIPQLHEIPQGKWRCCECAAKLYKKMQRCGECEDCLRPSCGQCTTCKGKMQFGGNGQSGKCCKFRHCKYMRYAAPERIMLNPSINDKKRRADSRLNLGAVVKLLNKRLSSADAQGYKVRSKSEKKSDIMSTSATTDSKYCDSRKLLDCPFRASSKPTFDSGLNCCQFMITRLKPTQKKSFLGEFFAGRIQPVVSSLTDDVNPERKIIQVSQYLRTSS